MIRYIPDDLREAQLRYMAKTGAQISQTEVQRLSAALQGGATVDHAVALVFDFFATPIDWDAERRSFAQWLARRRRGKIVGRVNITVIQTLP